MTCGRSVVFSTNKADRHDIIEILLKVALDTITINVILYSDSSKRRPLTHIMLYRVHLAWAGFKLTTLVGIDTDCIGSYKFNYDTIMTMTTPVNVELFFLIQCNNVILYGLLILEACLKGHLYITKHCL
jgi:hypothetical protein